MVDCLGLLLAHFRLQVCVLRFSNRDNLGYTELETSELHAPGRALVLAVFCSFSL